MGKGGQQAVIKVPGVPAAQGWESPYKPLDKNASELPTKGQIKASIPVECFKRSYFWSTFYLLRDLAMIAGGIYITSQMLSTDFPPLEATPQGVLHLLGWASGWSIYAICMGTLGLGPWVLAHECGHGAFSDSQAYNDLVGFVVHQALLVPYFAWQYTHAKHHRRTNHLKDGETHVPPTAFDNGLGPNLERQSFYAVIHEAVGDDAFAAFQVWTHLAIGWPLYLMGLASTGKLAHDGTELDGRIADHFRPSSPMFPSKVRAKIMLSTVTVVATLAALCYAKYVYGILPVVLWYWGPYHGTNAWLVIYTWLQHTDPSVPHYGEDEWTWVKGTLSTIDRDYGIFCFFHHRIGSTHVVHHLFHELPWYNAHTATKHLKAYLEPKGLYNYDPTPWYRAMWKIAHTCHFVEGARGVQYFKSLEQVPLTKDMKKKAQ